MMEGVEAASPVNTRMFFEFEFGAGNDEAGASEEIKKLFPKFWSQVLERTVSR